MDPIVLLQILITALTTLLENCKQTDEQKFGFLKSPGLIQHFLLDLELRREGLNRGDRKAAHEMADKLRAEATDDDLKNLIAASKSAA